MNFDRVYTYTTKQASQLTLKDKKRDRNKGKFSSNLIIKKIFVKSSNQLDQGNYLVPAEADLNFNFNSFKILRFLILNALWY